MEEGATEQLRLLRDELKSVHVDLRSVSKRLEDLESSRHHRYPPSASVGCDAPSVVAVADHRRSLARVLSIVSTKADADAVHADLASLEKSIGETASSASREAAAAVDNVLDSLREIVSSLARKTEVLSSDVACKVDKSVYKSMVADAESIRRRSEFVEETTRNVVDLKERADGNAERARRLEEEVKELSQDVRSLSENARHRAHQNDLSATNDRVYALEVVAEDLRVATTRDREESRAAAEKRVAETREIDRAAQALRRDHDAFVARCADDVRAVVDAAIAASASSCEGALATAIGELESRVFRELAETREELKGTTRRAFLAAEFVEWYGERDERMRGEQRLCVRDAPVLSRRRCDVDG